MNFLAPLFLLGAAAIALPILFHLIRRTSREKTVFSSLMFLQPSPPRVTRRSRLENILLLILRCLVFCVLAMGFARPFLNRPNAAPVVSGPGKRVTILLDNSASMRREGLWARAKERARETLKALSPADQAAVLLFNDQVRTVLSFEEWSATKPGERFELAISRINAAGLSWSGTRLADALLAGEELLEHSEAERGVPAEPHAARRIVVISDLQNGSHLDGLQGHEWAKGIEVALEPIRSQSRSNAGLHLVTEREDAALSSNQIPWRIRIANTPDARKEQFKVSWRGNPAATIESYIPPGQSRVLQPPPLPNSTAAELVLTGDDDTFDNALYWAETKAPQVNIVYLGSEPDTDATQPLYFLKRALQQTASQQTQITNISPRGEGNHTPLAIVADRLDEEKLDLVRTSLQSGKTVLVIMKTPDAAATIAKLIGSDPIAAAEAPVGNYALLGEIDFTHPLFRPFAEPRFSDFTKIHFWKYRRISADEIRGARILARFDSGDPALLQTAVEKGTLLIMTSTWSPADSQLALSTKFVPLLYSMLNFSGSPQREPAQYLVGDTVPYPKEFGASAAVRKPNGSEVAWPKDSRFTETDTPGIYTAVSAELTKRFAVNLTPAESKTTALTLEDFQQLGIPLKLATPNVAKAAARRAQQVQAAEMENQQKLWRWLLVFALVVIAAETWLAGRLSRVQPSA